MYIACGCMLLRTLFWDQLVGPWDTFIPGPNWGEEKLFHLWAPSLTVFSPSGENRERTVQPMLFIPDTRQLVKDENYLILNCAICRKRYSKWDEVSRNLPITDPVMLWGFFALGCSRDWVGASWGWEQWDLPEGGWAEQGLASRHLQPWDVEWGVWGVSPQVRVGAVGSMGFLPTSVIEEFVKYEYFICFRDIDTELFSLVTCTLAGCCKKWQWRATHLGMSVLPWRGSYIGIRADRWGGIQIICAEVVKSVTEATTNWAAVIPAAEKGAHLLYILHVNRQKISKSIDVITYSSRGLPENFQ